MDEDADEKNENGPDEIEEIPGDIRRKPSRATHLRLQNRKLRHIASLENHPDLVVLYLYNNSIRKLENLLPLSELTHLYLNDNDIVRIENLCHLKSLQKLYLGYNKIAVVEGLEGLHNLRELQVQGQRLRSGESLTLDPRAMEAVSSSLQILDVTNNGISWLKPLAVLKQLQELNCSDNQLQDLKSLQQELSQLESLQTLQMGGNPVCKLPRFRDCVVESCWSLEVLNAAPVQDNFRQFVIGRKQALLTRSSSSKISAAEGPPSRSMSAPLTASYGHRRRGFLPPRKTQHHKPESHSNITFSKSASTTSEASEAQHHRQQRSMTSLTTTAQQSISPAPRQMWKQTHGN